MIGPVQENDTSARVNAMKNMLTRPDVLSALESTVFDHREGSFISNPPRNDMPKITSSRKKAMLNHALVASSLRVDAPHMPVMARPRVRYITMMLSP